MLAAAVLATVNLAAVTSDPARERAPAPFVVLTDTGDRRDDLPVAARHPSPDPFERELTRGFSGRLLRLYQMAQRFAHSERPPQPAYLLLSNNQGGFPRVGLYLDGRSMPDTAYVDLHRDGDLTNRFGAMNQIYPHELLHVIVSDLVGPPPPGRDNQVHAIGVRTDRVTAFSEGFAEHAQVMAVEAEGAAADTRRLPADAEKLAETARLFDQYFHAAATRWSIAPKARMTFVMWFSRSEQVLRYHAVRGNLFARAVPVPNHLRHDLYRAYLIENAMPGPIDGTPKSAARMVATEGVVSALFYRLVSSRVLQQQYRDDDFYRQFGVARADLDPVDNVYLKLFAAIKAGGYDTVAVMDAYMRLFPDDAAAVRAILESTLLGQELPRAPAIWLMSERLKTGRSLFDQYRGMPRAHTFDLNAASWVDLASVRGMTPGVSAAILANAPFASVADLRRVPGAGRVAAEMERMETAYRAHVNAPDGRDSLSFRGVLVPYLWRALSVALACAVTSAVLYRAVRRVRWYRLAFNGVAVAIVGLVAGWTIDQGTGVLALAAPIAFWGLPAAVIALWRTRSPRSAALVLAAWSLASIVPALLVRPIG